MLCSSGIYSGSKCIELYNSIAQGHLCNFCLPASQRGDENITEDSLEVSDDGSFIIKYTAFTLATSFLTVFKFIDNCSQPIMLVQMYSTDSIILSWFHCIIQRINGESVKHRLMFLILLVQHINLLLVSSPFLSLPLISDVTHQHS
jgi:hypothetical protein